jgi:hypothetical protein
LVPGAGEDLQPRHPVEEVGVDLACGAHDRRVGHREVRVAGIDDQPLMRLEEGFDQRRVYRPEGRDRLAVVRHGMCLLCGNAGGRSPGDLIDLLPLAGGG